MFPTMWKLTYTKMSDGKQGLFITCQAPDRRIYHSDPVAVDWAPLETLVSAAIAKCEGRWQADVEADEEKAAQKATAQ